MATHELQIIRDRAGWAIGTVRLTLGGFWRGYSYTLGFGSGPFATRDDAEAFVRCD